MAEPAAAAPEAAPESAPEQVAAPAAVATPATDPTPILGTSTDTNEPSPWSWAENVPGEGAKPEWYQDSKYKSIEEQAKALPELAKKLGPAAEIIGAPEGGEYTTPAPPEGTVGEYHEDDPMLKSLATACKNLNLSQKVYEAIAAEGAKAIAAANAEAETSLADNLAALGDNLDARINQVREFVVGKLGAEAYDSLSNTVGTDPQAYAALEKIVGMAFGDAQLAQGSGIAAGGMTLQDVNAERYKVFPPEHGRAGQIMYEHDADHRKRVDDLYKKIAPGPDQRFVG